MDELDVLVNYIDQYKLLKQKRQEGMIDKHTTIFLDFHNKEIGIHSDGGRLIRPVLIVDNNKINNI